MPTYLLLESGGHLLLESGGRVELESTVTASPVPPYYLGGAPPDEILAVLLGPSAKVTRRAEILHHDGTLWRSDVNLVGGNVNVDITRDERRSIDVTFDNDDLVIGSGNFWYDKLVRVYRGIDAGSLGTWETPLGTFMPDTIDQQSANRSVHVVGRDLTKRLITSAITDAITFVQGTDGLAIVSAMAALGGVTNMVLPNIGCPLPADLTFDADTSRWDIIKQVVTAFNMEAFFDAYGYLVVRTFQDPFVTPASFTFQTGKSAGNLVQYTKTATDGMLYNHIVVRGESDSTTIPVQGEAIVTDPSSPIHPDLIGDRTFPYQSSLITTQAQADALATSLLKVYALEQFTVQIDAIAIPWLDGGNVVGFIDPNPANADDPERFLLQSFTIGLDTGPMSGQIGRVETRL